jgi:hypothetical protein
VPATAAVATGGPALGPFSLQARRSGAFFQIVLRGNWQASWFVVFSRHVGNMIKYLALLDVRRCVCVPRMQSGRLHAQQGQDTVVSSHRAGAKASERQGRWKKQAEWEGSMHGPVNFNQSVVERLSKASRDFVENPHADVEPNRARFCSCLCLSFSWLDTSPSNHHECCNASSLIFIALARFV